jgi:hypothetical protein
MHRYNGTPLTLASEVIAPNVSGIFAGNKRRHCGKNVKSKLTSETNQHRCAMMS